MSRLVLLLTWSFSFWFLPLLFGKGAEPPAPPPTPVKPVTDVYHGVRVVDPYRWLENAKDPAVRHWVEAENKYTQTFLDRLPDRAAIRKRLQQLYDATSPGYSALIYRAGQLFALKSQPPKNQPFLVTLKSADDPASAHVILDPNKLNAKGTTAIDFYVPTRDGKRVAVSLSEGGTEEGTVYVYETATGKKLSDVVPRVNGGTAGGSLAWNADGTGFYYTRYPRGNERPPADRDFYQQIYFHKLGTPTEQDTYALGKDFPRIAEIKLQSSRDGRYILATVANGDGGEFEHFLLGPSDRWERLTHFADQITGAVFGRDQALYLLSLKGAPRGKILRLPLDRPRLDQARTIVPESKATVEGFLPTAGLLYVVDMVGGPSDIRVFDLEGHEKKPVPQPPIASVSQVVGLKGDDLLFNTQTFIAPPAWYHYDPATGKAKRTALFRTSPADFRDVEVVRDFAVSRDGTRVPLNILRRKGLKLNGENPTILYGYGGFNISLAPSFSVSRSIWLDQGGVYVIANLRGGGEYGEAWHKGGNLTHKQNVFDDFTACARYLIEKKYTNPNKLGILGGSNGGLLMGAVLTQHPELFRAVVSLVGLYDMLRFERFPNGVFNVTEYGSVKNPEQFRAIYAYSPYQHVKKGTAYPAVLLMTGFNDPRVDPANSWKMAARLQAATTSGRPVLLLTTFGAGHGVDSSLAQRVRQETDLYAFLFHELGVKYRPVR